MTSENKDGELLLMGMGNPLLDISADVPDEFLAKYEVKTNTAILADEKHLPIYDDMVKTFKVSYIAGGATQNTIRVAQWMLQQAGATAYIGSVGKDEFGEQLRKCATDDGVKVVYYPDEKLPTGTCAVLVNNKDRALITKLNAAETWNLDRLKSDLIAPVWKAAKFFFIEGFFFTHSTESIQFLAKHSHETGKTFAMGLSAPFICQFFSKPLLDTMPWIDVIVGNESEAKAFGETMKYSETTPERVAMELYNLPKEKKDKPRLVIVTQGPHETIVVQNGKLTKYAVPKVDPKDIVDTNGAGDAFTGGFLSQYTQGKSIEESIKAGHYAARVILGVSGTQLPKHKPAAHDKW